MTPNSQILPIVLTILSREEGCELEAYQDTGGVWTIGWGRADAGVHEGMTCTQAEADEWRLSKVNSIFPRLDIVIPWWRQLDAARAAVLVCMVYQMGLAGVLGFKNTLAEMKAGAWTLAAQGMLASAWHTQTPERAERMAQITETGVVDE